MNCGTKRSWTNWPPPWCGNARDAGALAGLPQALVFRAGVHLLAGEFATAATLIEEANSITAATDYYGPVQISLGVARRLAGSSGRGVGADRGGRRGWNRQGRRAVARTDRIRRGHALQRPRPVRGGVRRRSPKPASTRISDSTAGALFELIEAASRCGEHDEAALAVRRLEQRAGASGTDWGLGAMASARALLADDDHADSLFTEAIEHLERTRVVVHLARTRLAYGEWLRRAHQPYSTPADI